MTKVHEPVEQSCTAVQEFTVLIRVQADLTGTVNSIDKVVVRFVKVSSFRFLWCAFDGAYNGEDCGAGGGC